ncbi:hypothetical protein B566_EDAN013777 [Ephemera danica]|nr:hypothetical protein B566_EDAN013777 [Ephemera danica]
MQYRRETITAHGFTFEPHAYQWQIKDIAACLPRISLVLLHMICSCKGAATLSSTSAYLSRTLRRQKLLSHERRPGHWRLEIGQMPKKSENSRL